MFTRQRGAAAALILLLVLVAGCRRSAAPGAPLLLTPDEGADVRQIPGTPVIEPAEGSGNAARRQISELFSGESGATWDELDPAEQAIVPRNKFVQCAGRSVPGALQTVTLESEYDTTVGVAAVPEQTGRSVTLDVRTTAGTVRQTVVEVAVAGHWRWVLGDQAVAAYQAGECPGG